MSVGDLGTPLDGACDCSITLPRMGPVGGRMIDCITLPDGQRISPYRLTCTIEDVPGINRYQIVQKTHELIEVSIVPDARFNAETTRLVITLLEALFQRHIRVNSIIVDHLSKDESGKYRVVHSEISASNSPELPGNAAGGVDVRGGIQ